MIKPGEIQNKARAVGVRDQQIEKDYILSWILQGIAAHKRLSISIVFKRIFCPPLAILAARLCSGLEWRQYGHLVVTTISAGLISLTITPWLIRPKKG